MPIRRWQRDNANFTFIQIMRGRSCTLFNRLSHKRTVIPRFFMWIYVCVYVNNHLKANSTQLDRNQSAFKIPANYMNHSTTSLYCTIRCMNESQFGLAVDFASLAHLYTAYMKRFAQQTCRFRNSMVKGYALIVWNKCSINWMLHNIIFFLSLFLRHCFSSLMMFTIRKHCCWSLRYLRWRRVQPK